VVAERPVTTGTETIGAVALLGPGAAAAAGVHDLLTMAAIATLTELAIADARDEADEARQSSLIELIRAHADVPDEELLRRAYRLGSDLSAGAVALCCDLHEDRPRYVADLIHGQQPRALVDHIDRRVYALIPPAPGARDRERVALEAARSLAGVLEPYGTVGFSPYCASLRHLARAIEESELTLEVLLHDGGESSGIDSSTYRLLVRTLAASPEEVRRFYENTVAALVRYDDQYRTELLGTLDAYLAHNCNMNATAAAIFAHRHTVAYRLERVRELTGLDPAVSEHRERLGLGLKAHRILAPRLVR
jgi:sugar diacid utilization regulator